MPGFRVVASKNRGEEKIKPGRLQLAAILETKFQPKKRSDFPDIVAERRAQYRVIRLLLTDNRRNKIGGKIPHPLLLKIT